MKTSFKKYLLKTTSAFLGSIFLFSLTMNFKVNAENTEQKKQSITRKIALGLGIGGVATICSAPVLACLGKCVYDKFSTYYFNNEKITDKHIIGIWANPQESATDKNGLTQFANAIYLIPPTTNPDKAALMFYRNKSTQR